MNKFINHLLPAFFSMAVLVSCSTISSDPEALADYALKCFQENNRDGLTIYATHSYAKGLKEMQQSEERMEKAAKTNEKVRNVLDSTRKIRKQIAESTFEKAGTVEVADGYKQFTYTAKTSLSNSTVIRILIKEEDGLWKIDQIGL